MKTTEQKLSDLEREETYKVEQRRKSKYNERLTKWKTKAEAKADEVERKVRSTYKKKREKIIRLSKWLTAKTPAEERKEYYKKLFRETSHNFSCSVRICEVEFDPTSISFEASCYTCWGNYTVCVRDHEKEKRTWNRAFQNWHMIKKWSWNWLKFYREVCRGQCVSCNVFNSTLQEERSEQLKLEIGEEAHAKAKRARKPKKFTIEELEQIKQESISIVEKQLDKAKNYI